MQITGVSLPLFDDGGVTVIGLQTTTDGISLITMMSAEGERIVSHRARRSNMGIFAQPPNMQCIAYFRRCCR